MNEITKITTAKDWATRPGSALVPGLRRLCRAEGGPADHARPRHGARKDRVRQRHRLLEPLPLLHGELRLPHHPRPRPRGRDRGQARQSRARRVDHHRRRRRAVDRRQPHDALAAPQPRLPVPAVQQRDLRPDQGPIFADQPDRHALALDPVRLGRPPGQPVRLRARVGRAVRRARRSTSTRTCPTCSRPRTPTSGASFVEIFQNCIVYNDDVFAPFTAKEVAADKQLWLKAGEKMLFAGGAKGIALDAEALTLKVVDAATTRRCIVHDPKNRSIAHMLVEMPTARFPGRARRDLRGSRADLRQRGASSRTAPSPPARRPTSRRSSPRARPGRSRRNRAPNRRSAPSSWTISPTR